jgi:4-hydroxyphenylpyruvate dioxygenase
LETGNRETTSYVAAEPRQFRFDDAAFARTSGGEHIKQHGDGVRDIAFQVEDADHAFNEAVKRGAKAAIEPHDWQDENGSVRKAAIHTYGDTIHSFISYNNNNGHNYSGRVSARICRTKSAKAKMSASFWLTTSSATSNSAK